MVRYWIFFLIDGRVNHEQKASPRALPTEAPESDLRTLSRRMSHLSNSRREGGHFKADTLGESSVDMKPVVGCLVGVFVCLSINAAGASHSSGHDSTGGRCHRVCGQRHGCPRAQRPKCTRKLTADTNAKL